MKRPRLTSPPGTNRWTLHFVLLGGALAWLLHLIFAYVIAEFGILSGLVETRWLGLDAVSVLLLGLSTIMLLLAATATAVAWRQQKRWRPATSPPDETGRTREFCARFGVAANVTFLAIIAVQTIPIFFFLRT